MNPIQKSIDKAIAVSRQLQTEKQFYDHLKAKGLYPHDGQKSVLKALFRDKKKHVFLQCGRNFGKSHVMAISAILQCIMFPGSRVYVIAPFRSQAYEIYWASSLIHSMIPRHFLLDGDDGFNKSELRANFRNGSFLKIDGADNEDALRGIKPHWLGCDEFQAWREGSYESMEPNLLAHDATCFKIGTPPDRENYFTHNADYVEKQMKAGKERYFFMRRPTSSNPRISKESLEEIRLRYVARGEEEIYTREYEAIFVPGGASAIFKMFNKDAHTRPMDWVMARLAKDFHKCEAYTVLDPGSTSVFAGGFFLLNRDTGEAFLLEEIYEKDDKLTSTGCIWPRVMEIEKRLFGGMTPIRFYDEAAAWFFNEVGNQFPENCALTPTNKRAYARTEDTAGDACSVVKDAFILRKFYIVDTCVNTIEEMINYHKNEKGQIAKNQPDHAVDFTKYFFHESGWSSSRGVIQATLLSDIRGEPFEVGRKYFKSEEEERFVPNFENSLEDYELEDMLIC